MGNQLSTDYSAAVGPILIISTADPNKISENALRAYSRFWPVLANFGPILAEMCFGFGDGDVSPVMGIS